MSVDPRPQPVAVPGYYESDRSEVVDLVPAQGARVLDIGCGAGVMGQALKARGAREVVGVEIVPEMAALARERLDAVHQLDVQRGDPLPYDDGHFDVITCADVLEHLVDPATVLRHLRRYLRPGGTLICSIPNVRHESVALRLLVEGRWRYEDHGILDRTHLRFFTLEEMRLLLRESGFVLSAPPAAVRAPASAYLDRTAALVQLLGGDVPRFRDEATVVQYLLTARPVAAQLDATPDPWAGAHPVRVLVMPRWDDRNDCWQPALQALCGGIGSRDRITVGVAAPAGGFDQLPAAFLQLLASSPADLRILPAATGAETREALLTGARVLLLTGRDPALTAEAKRHGLEVIDGRPQKTPPPVT